VGANDGGVDHLHLAITSTTASKLLCGLLQASEVRPSPSDLEQPSEADQEVLRELQRRMKKASS
jgi:hypothetical protein